MLDFTPASEFKVNESQSQQIFGYFKESRLFNYLSDHLLMQIAKSSQLEHYAQKELILKENEMNECLFF